MRSLPLALIALLRLQDPLPREFLEDFEATPGQDSIVAGWERVRSPGHPAWNKIERVFDPKLARSGTHYLRMTSMGGSTAVQMTRESAWPIDPAHSYRLSALVLLGEARRDVAALSALWLDRHDAVIGEARATLRGRGNDWRELVLDLSPAPPEAARAAVRLSLEGPDLKAECSFDHVSLSRPPRLTLAPALGLSRFTLSAKELPEGRLRADILLRAPGGREKPIKESQPIRNGSPVEIDLPSLEPGVYILMARVGGLSREWPILVPPAPWLASAGQIPLISGAFDPSEREIRNPARLAEIGGFQRARVAIWHGQASPRARELVLELVKSSVAVVGLIDAPPPEVFPEVDPKVLEKGIGSLRTLDRRLWEPELEALLRRYREFVPWWQPGDSLVKTEDLPRTFEGERALTITSSDPGDLLRRLILQASSGSDPSPVFVPVEPLVDGDGFPKAGFLALRAANDILSGATPRPELRALFGPPVRAAFEKAGRVVVALWSDGEEIEREIDFGPGAEVYSPLAGVSRLIPDQRLRVGAMPLFVGKIDRELLETELSLRLVHPYDASIPGSWLPLELAPATRVLKFRNRSKKRPITGLRVNVEAPLPRGWIVRPARTRDLSLAPGEELQQEFSFLLPATEDEGERAIHLALQFTQDGRERVLRRSFSIRVVPQIQIALEVARAPGLDDAKEVTVRIRNDAARPVTLVATVRLPGRPEQTEPLGTLEPQSSAGRTLKYVVRDLRQFDPARLKVEVLCEERGNTRLRARKESSLR